MESGAARQHVLFVGRLTGEKGLNVLLDAWRQLSSRVPLLVVGEGDRLPSLPPAVRAMGRLELAEVYALMKAAVCVVVPGRWPEPFGRVVIEAFANGTPVIASDLGGVTEIIRHGVNGFLYDPEDSASLARQLEQLLTNPNLVDRMGARARNTYLERFTAETNLHQLEQIYREAVAAQNAERR